MVHTVTKKYGWRTRLHFFNGLLWPSTNMRKICLPYTIAIPIPPPKPPQAILLANQTPAWALLWVLKKALVNWLPLPTMIFCTGIYYVPWWQAH